MFTPSQFLLIIKGVVYFIYTLLPDELSNEQLRSQVVALPASLDAVTPKVTKSKTPRRIPAVPRRHPRVSSTRSLSTMSHPDDYSILSDDKSGFSQITATDPRLLDDVSASLSRSVRKHPSEESIFGTVSKFFDAVSVARGFSPMRVLSVNDLVRLRSESSATEGFYLLNINQCLIRCSVSTAGKLIHVSGDSTTIISLEGPVINPPY